MRVQIELFAAMVAVLFIVTQSLSATAAPPRLVYLDCPEPAAVGAITGKEPLTAQGPRGQCDYFTPDVSFQLRDVSLAELRAAAEADGHDVVDAPGAGEGAFQYASDAGMTLNFERDGRALSIVSNTLGLEVLIQLVGLAGDSISLSPELMPAAPFEVTCPTAKQLSTVLGEQVLLEKDEARSCRYSAGAKWVWFDVSDFGLVTESLTYRQLESRGLPGSYAFNDLEDLGPGAYWFADLSPLSVTWQHAEGVVFSVMADPYGQDDLRRVAVLFNSVQAGGETPGKPGMPSTGV